MLAPCLASGSRLHPGNNLSGADLCADDSPQCLMSRLIVSPRFCRNVDGPTLIALINNASEQEAWAWRESMFNHLAFAPAVRAMVAVCATHHAAIGRPVDGVGRGKVSPRSA